MRIAIVGAGVAGLGACMALAKDGHDVVLLERDATPLPETPDAAFDWKRGGAPQVRHSHAFLARGRNLLRDQMPDVLRDLLDAGATEVRWADMRGETLETVTPQPGDDDLTMLCCRRTTFEWTLRRAALRTDRVELRDGTTVKGLLHTTNGATRITGVRTDAGDVEADVVLDATGRPGHFPDMLRDIGLTLRESTSQTGIVYLSRFYRLREGAEVPDANAFNGAELGYLKFAVFRGDNRTFSITIAYWTDDTDMRQLRDPTLFDAATRAIPLTRAWVDPEVSEPISKVNYMGGLINRIRSFVPDGEPLALGLLGVGDASVCTNPLYGRGCSLGLVHGALFAESLRDHGEDLRELALSFEDATQRELIPWYVASRGQDKSSIAQHQGKPLSEFEAYMRSVAMDGIFPAAMIDEHVSRAWFRAFNLLGTPDSLMSDPTIMQRVLEVYNDRDSREPPPLQGPERDEFLEIIGRA